MRRLLVCCSALLLLSPASRARQADAPPYLPPAGSMAMMQVEPGFRVELVASEPDVQSPVAMDIDEDGRIWVVEMPGYPLDAGPTGRVKLLEDTDGDGRVDDQHALCRQPAAAQRRDALQEGRARHGAARPPLLRGRQRRRQGRHARGRAHRLCEDQPAARGEPPGVRPRQLDLPRALGPAPSR